MSNSTYIRIRRPATGHLTGDIAMPGSKSETNRALVIGAFAPHPFHVRNYSRSEDSLVFLRFLQAVGIEVRIEGVDCIVVGSIADSTRETVVVDLGQAGTALRFLTTLATFLNGETILTGSQRLGERPFAPLVDCLRKAGGAIEYLEEKGHLPLKVKGDPSLMPTSFNVEVSQSSQMLSALLLAAPRLSEGSRLYFDENKLVSAAYVDLTVNLLKELGVEWRRKASCLELVRNSILGKEYTVAGDWSAASYWLGLCATLPGDVRLRNLDLQTYQGDRAQVELFQSWGLEVTALAPHTLQVVNTRGNLVRPLTHDFTLTPDLAQTFAVLATFADEPSRLYGLDTLPLKETDRLAALSTELHRLGVSAEKNKNYLEVTPKSLSLQTPIDTHHDHRMALSFSILANRLPYVDMLEPDVIRKSYPDYWDDMMRAGYEVEYVRA